MLAQQHPDVPAGVWNATVVAARHEKGKARLSAESPQGARLFGSINGQAPRRIVVTALALPNADGESAIIIASVIVRFIVASRPVRPQNRQQNYDPTQRQSAAKFAHR